jgi:hypothetical protein
MRVLYMAELGSCRFTRVLSHSFLAIEYELLTEAYTELSVVLNCSGFSLPEYCLPPPPLLLLTTPCPPAVSPPPDTHGERIWSSFRRQKVYRGLLLLIHYLCPWLAIPSCCGYVRAAWCGRGYVTQKPYKHVYVLDQ